MLQNKEPESDLDWSDTEIDEIIKKASKKLAKPDSKRDATKTPARQDQDGLFKLLNSQDLPEDEGREPEDEDLKELLPGGAYTQPDPPGFNQSTPQFSDTEAKAVSDDEDQENEIKLQPADENRSDIELIKAKVFNWHYFDWNCKTWHTTLVNDFNGHHCDMD